MADRIAKVLLVEDAPSLARVYVEYLKKDAYDVTAVETGAEALAILADGVSRVVLLDLQLPDMHGMDVLKRIQADGLPCPRSSSPPMDRSTWPWRRCGTALMIFW